MSNESVKQQVMSPEDFKAAIENYIRRPDFDYSILISGEWGSGKTYYFKNCLVDKNTGSINNTGAELILVSVGGLSTTNEVKENIGIELLARFGKFPNSNKLDLIFESDIASCLPEYGKNIFNVAQKGLDSLRSYSQDKILNAHSDKLILVIDDLERYQGQLSTLLAFIHNHYVNNGAHVIYIANEKEIEDCKYKQAKEKYIRYTFSFHASIKDVLGNLIANRAKESCLEMFTSKNEQIADWISNMNIFNLRTINFAIDCYIFFAGGHSEEDKEYLFKLILLHVDFITHNAKDYENEYDEYIKYLKTKGLYITIYHDPFFDNSEFPYQKTLSTFIHTSYVSAEEKEEMLSLLFPVDNEYSRALISLRNSETMEMGELLEKVNLVLKGVDLMKIPYERLSTVANWLEGLCFCLDEEINAMNYKEKITKAITAPNYPKKDSFLLKYDKNDSRHYDEHMPFTQEVCQLLNAEYDKFHEERQKNAFIDTFNALNTLDYYEIHGDIKGKIFPLICKYELLPELKKLNNRGIGNIDIEQYKLSDSAINQVECIKQIISQLEKDLKDEKYDKYAQCKRNRIIAELKDKINKIENNATNQ